MPCPYRSAPSSRRWVKYYVSVIDGNGEAQNREVTPGQKVGKFWIINDGLQDGDTIIVDGYQKAKGAALDQHLLTKADIDNDSSDTSSDTSSSNSYGRRDRDI